MKMNLRKCIMMLTIALLTVVTTPLMHAITAKAAANINVTSSGIVDISFTKDGNTSRPDNGTSGSVNNLEAGQYTLQVCAELTTEFQTLTISINGTETDYSAQVRAAHTDRYSVDIDITNATNSINVTATTAQTTMRTIIWTYDPAEDHDGEMLVQHGRAEMMSGATDFNSTATFKHYYGYQGDTVTIRLIPDPGYQIAGASINGTALTAQAGQSEFSFVLGTGHVRFAGAFTKVDPQAAVASSGNVTAMTATVPDTNVNTGSVAVIATGNQANPAEDTVKNAMGSDSADYISTVETMNIDMFNIVSKGGNADYASDAGNYWVDHNMTDLASDASLALKVTNTLGAGETFGVVREHNGNYTEIDSVYNSSTGNLRFASNEFSNYTIIKKKGTPETNPTADPTTQTASKVSFAFPVYTVSVAPHVHNYEWRTLKEATEDEDGEYAYVCRTCGDVRYRVPIGAYATFNINTQNKIRNAAKDATVEISTTRWISFHRMVMDALKERPDVTLKVNYLSDGYKGDPMTFTIPAGTDTGALPDENGYAGFKFLGGIFGATARQ